MEVDQLIARLAKGGRTQELTTGERAVGSNRIFRMWTENQTRIMKVYGTPARERRERHSLTALRGISGIPNVLDRGAEGDVHWAIFEDAGSWNLATLPENAGLTKRAGEILRQVHESDMSAISN